jgi:hypothetical protein
MVEYERSAKWLNEVTTVNRSNGNVDRQQRQTKPISQTDDYNQTKTSPEIKESITFIHSIRRIINFEEESCRWEERYRNNNQD